MSTDLVQAAAVCRYLRGEVERLEGELEEKDNAIENLWEMSMGEDL